METQDAGDPPDGAPDDRRGARTGMIVATVVIVAALLAGFALTRTTGPTSRSAPRQGPPTSKEAQVVLPDSEAPHAAPPFTLTGLGGGSIDLRSFAGKPLVLNFWASWCIPCRAEMPTFQQVSRQLKGKVQFLGVASNDGPGPAKKFAKEVKVTYPLALDAQGKLAESYGVYGLPSTYLIDAQGRIVASRFGEQSREQLEAMLAAKFPQLGITTR